MKTILKSFLAITTFYFGTIILPTVSLSEKFVESNYAVYANPDEDDDDDDDIILPPITHCPVPEDSIVYLQDGTIIILLNKLNFSH
jgi:hypothetical protein